MFDGKAILFYSGGKDSIATLHVMREYIDRCLVVWINTGDPLPEVREHMDRVKARVPHFREVVSDFHKEIEVNGYPVDVLPISASRALQSSAQGHKSSMRSWVECCNNNIWWPTQKLMDELAGEYKTIIRGQKGSDRLRAKTYSGQKVDGFDMLYPLEGWKDADVFAYIKDNDLDLPEHYSHFGASIDCWACTAHTRDNQGKLGYLLAFHPDQGDELQRRMKEIINETDREMDRVRNFVESR